MERHLRDKILAESKLSFKKKSRQGSEYGMATLTSKPLISTKVFTLPDAKYELPSSIVHEVQIAKGCKFVYLSKYNQSYKS